MKKLLFHSKSSFLTKTFNVALFLFALTCSVKVLGQTDSTTITTTGTSTWMAPAGVTSVTVQAWGGGGGGGSISAAAAARGGGGGGGGGFSQGTVAVVPGTSYTVVVGTGGGGAAAAAGATGGESYFINATTVMARGGTGGGEGTGGNGGGALGAGAAVGVGTITRNGGNGAAGVNVTRGGAGGGGAGTTGNGGNAATTTAGTGAAYDGGNGGAGRTTTGVGNTGSLYGGGGGGSYKTGTAVTDAGGAGRQGIVILSWNAAPALAINSITNVTCNGGNNGTATVNPSGGTSPYTYLWSDVNSQTTPTATGLVAGTYTITVTDNTGLTASTSATITQPNVLSVSTSVIANACHGESNGSATATISGGTSPYTYSWNDPSNQTTATAIGLSAGTYTVTVMDSCGATATASATIAQPGALNAAITVLANVNCNGGNDGRAAVSISGGTSPYTYLWNDLNSQTTATATGLIAGEYTVTVTDSCDGSVTAGAIITQPTLITSSATVTGNVICNGGDNGSASVSVSGGTPPYTYLWNDPSSQSAATATGLGAGTYTVNITDNTECAGSAVVTITQPNALSVLTTVNGISCNGGANGSILASPAGGTAPFTYLWNDASSQTTATATGLPLGTYTVSVSDNCGATATASATMTQPNVLTVSDSVVNSTCYGLSTGSVSANPSGGTAPYTYLWNDANSQTGATATGLGAGTYTVSVTDNNGCTASSSATLTEPNVLAASTIVVANATCYDAATGRITVSVSGGTSPYTYAWNDPNAQTTATATGLTSGAYTVTVTDNCGATATASGAITEPVLLTSSAGVTANVSCNSGDNGSATSSATGGTPPYTYLWSDPSSQTTAAATGLVAGTYTVTITDINECGSVSSVTITEPTALTVSAAVVSNVICGGGNTGSISASPAGGVTPYTYLWNDAGSQTTATASNLTAGSYTVTVTDNNGCSATASATITQPAALVVLTDVTSDVTCIGGDNGSASASVAGGATPYTYYWSNGRTTTSIDTLLAGIYTITITDNIGCSATVTATVTQPAALTASASGSNVTCNGGNDGRATASVSGGTAPYSYVWNDPNVQTTVTATGLSAGEYIVIVTDNCGNTATAYTVVGQPAQITASASVIDNVLCNSQSTGSASASGGGGTVPYTYLWNPSGETTATANGLSAGSYTVTITDYNGCAATAGVNITQPVALSASAATTGNVTCNGGDNGSATASAAYGNSPYTYLWSDGQTTTAAAALSAGVYVITVTDNCGQTATSSATVTQPVALSTSATATNTSCIGGDNGTATASPGGGNTPYTYLWSDADSQTNVTATGLIPGTYTVTVTDNCGATATASAAVGQPSPLGDTALVVSNVTCNGGDNGSISASVSGGTSPYMYLWSNSEKIATATGLSVGSYSVTVTDNCGFTASSYASVTQPNPLTVSDSLFSIACSGGTAVASPSGGTLPYTFKWSDANSQTTATATGLATGSYTITVSDNCGATATASVAVAIPPFSVSASVTGVVSCNGGDNGSASASPSGGIPPYTYVWTGPGSETTQSATGLPIGTYTVTATDNCGSTATASVAVGGPAALSASTGVNDITCNGATTGLAYVSQSGGTAPYTFLWSGAGSQTTATAVGLSAGTYTVTVTDICGDLTTADAVVTQPNALSPSTTVTNVTCFGGDNGTASVSPNGGTAPYTYTWNDASSQVTATATGLVAGSYTVTVTDNCGASASASAVVTQPNALSIASAGTISNVSCFNGNNGSASVTPSDGTSPYTYLWSGSGSQTTATVSGLVAGSYTVTVTDNCGAIVTDSTVITQPNALTASASITTNISCNGADNGSASVSATGGTVPYTYQWNDVNSQTGVTANGLSAGVYMVTVTDNNGCNTIASVTVTQPNVLVASASVTANANCNGANDGIASASASGGTSPYSYLWNDANSQTTASASDLVAGSYTVIITDNNGCTATASVGIAEPTAVSPTAAVTINESCNGESIAVAKVSVTGGAAPYTYLWTPGNSTSYIASGLSAGAYIVTVTDKNGCTGTAAVNVTQPTAIIDSVSSITYPSCYGGTGSVTIGVRGGTPSYGFRWNPSVSNTATADNITARVYTVTVKDANGCTSSLMVVVTQPAQMVVITDSINQSSSSPCNGIAAVLVNGGTAPYTYEWVTGGQTTAAITGQCAGSYCCSITDNHGCTEDVCVKIKNVTAVQDITSDAGHITIYPNPSKGQFTIESTVASGKSVVEITNVLGQDIYSTLLNFSQGSTFQINLGTQPSGVYFYRIISSETGELLSAGKLVIAH